MPREFVSWEWKRNADQIVVKLHMWSYVRPTFSSARTRNTYNKVPNKIMKRSVETQAYGYGFTTTLKPSSVPRAKNNHSEDYTHFLNHYQYCNKRICDQDIVYMYGRDDGVVRALTPSKAMPMDFHHEPFVLLSCMRASILSDSSLQKCVCTSLCDTLRN